MSKWTVQDRSGHTIYCTEERWQHILESRPEIEPLFDRFLETVHTGRRKQDPLIPNEYRYYKRFDEIAGKQPLGSHRGLQNAPR